MMKNAALLGYRMMGTMLLYGTLLWTAWFCVKLLFYACNGSWIVPTVVTKQDPRVLDAAEKIITTKQAIELLILDAAKNRESIVEMSAHRTQLATLYPQLVKAISTETDEGRIRGQQLRLLNAEALAQNEIAAQRYNEAVIVSNQIEIDLKAGLITKAEAAIKESEIAQSGVLIVNNEIQSVTLKDQIAQKVRVGTQTLDALGKWAELRDQIVTLDVTIAAAQRQLASDVIQAKQLSMGLQLVNDTPYAAVLDGRQDFAFVPYDAEKNLAVGSPVYACYGDFVFCRQVGTVAHIYTNEEQKQNPVAIPLVAAIIRGVMAEIDFTDPTAVKSQTLFVSHKPLGI